MQTTSTTKSGTVEYMPSKGEHIPGTGVYAGRALTTLNYTVKATLEVPPESSQKKKPGLLRVVIQVGERPHSFTLRWNSNKLPSDRQCKKWLEEHVTDLLPDKKATNVRVK